MQKSQNAADTYRKTYMVGGGGGKKEKKEETN